MAFFSMRKADPQKQHKTVWDELYKQRTAISAFLAVVVLTAGGWFLVYPRWKVLRQIRDLTTQQRAKNEELGSLARRLETFEKNYGQAKELEKKSSITDVAAESLDFARILTEIVAIAKESNIPLVSVSVNEQKEVAASKSKEQMAAPLPKGVKSIDISIDFKKGDDPYVAYKSFLGALEQALPLYDVQVFSIGAKKESESVSAATLGKEAGFIVQTYYYDAGKKDQPKPAANTVSIAPQ